MSIIDAVETEAKKVDAASVSKVILDIGTMAGIEFHALDTAMEMAVLNTMMEKSDVQINKVQARAVCSSCNREFDIEAITDNCPFCDHLFHKVIAGKELKIKSITVEE